MSQPTAGDLARQMLRQQIAAAKSRGTMAATRPAKSRRARYSDGRDPVDLGAAITRLAADHAWEAPVAGANVIEQWPSIAPELAGKVAAERWEADRRVLHLRPSSPAYATQLRLLGAQLVARINAKAAGVQVAAIRVLPPGTSRGGDQPTPQQTPSVVSAVATVPMPVTPPPAGYEAARRIVAAARTERDQDRELRDAHFSAHRGWLREPEDAFTEAAPPAPTPLRETSSDIHRRALAAARAQKAGGPIPGIRRLADTA